MKVLLAGIGNVFLGDDGFGVEVAHRLRDVAVPDGVTVADFGIRGVHLAYELLDGYDAAVLVDALPRGGPPGTVYVFEPAADAPEDAAGPVMDAHAMTPDAVLALVRALGGTLPRVVVVGCEPADVGERMGLSEPVAAAVDRAAGEALAVVRSLVTDNGRV
jgi:hydrogenase maturation protease